MAQRQRRGQETVRDMVLSLGVVMAGVAIFVIFVMPRGNNEQAIKVVATAQPMAAFARQSPFTPVLPVGLPADVWKPTSLRVQLPVSSSSSSQTAQASIGYVIDRSGHRTFARLRETNAPDAVQTLLGDRPSSGTVDVNGESWQARPDHHGHVAITHTQGGVTIVLDDGDGKGGGATQADLITLARALRPVEPTT
ncbi:DUF4245 domain-containing protein [Frankia sp. AgPm24]|uniref:DUF4245 domain-containing protein n=1 Tax=Frankia sp. AgPm24 TaxID=631128 RepID=UPI0027E240A6|nr:DUF4245 domain-containing protein [Frankia sp. AgPm24]